MHVLRIECRADQKDRVVADLWERGTAGIVEEDLPGGACRLKAFFDSTFDSGALGGGWERAEDRDWVDVSHEQWEPVLVGERFYLVPEWRDDPAPAGRIRLEMQPGTACGTGWGPATQLALEGMERVLRPGAAVLDLGTGSGILAVAAARLGASRVFACDIDLDAAGVARGRFLRERIDVGLFCGSLRSVRDAAADLVVANINAETIASLAAELERILAPRGGVVLTGFPERHMSRVTEKFGPPADVLEREEWRAVVYRR